MKKLIGCALLFVTLCSFWPFSSGSASVKVRLRTDMDTNHGAPFYVFIKEVEKTQFLKDEYQDIVQEALEEATVIFPGKNYTLQFPKQSADKAVGIYCLFTDPGDEWKMLASTAKKVDVILGNTEILRASIR